MPIQREDADIKLIAIDMDGTLLNDGGSSRRKTGGRSRKRRRKEFTSSSAQDAR